MTLALSIFVLIVAGVTFVWLIGKRQRKKDQRFLDRLRVNGRTLKLRTTILEERVSLDDQSTVLRQLTIEDGELLVGQGFMLLVHLMAAIHNPSILPAGAKGITWSIPLDNCEIRGDSLIAVCTLPDDEDSFTRLRFEGLFADDRSEAVMDALGLNQDGKLTDAANH